MFCIVKLKTHVMHETLYQIKNTVDKSCWLSQLNNLRKLLTHVLRSLAMKR